MQLDWRARLVPAAAVTPAPRVSVVDAAVKKSVVKTAGMGGDRDRVTSWR